MTHPYRRPALGAEDGGAGDPEAMAIYGVLGVLGLVRLVVAVAMHEVFGGECTIALAMVLAAGWGLASRFARR